MKKFLLRLLILVGFIRPYMGTAAVVIEIVSNDGEATSGGTERPGPETGCGTCIHSYH
ncbi:MAG: hypothetical protein NDI69_18135 [Bacteriovoracaceae bacterium]|nr:hypothetical protein [Bacteriovoracaceae bacterium]